MKSLNALWVAGVTAALVSWGSGCAEEPPTGIVLDDPPPPSTGPGMTNTQGAQAFFEATVFPELSAMCSSCHVAGAGIGAPEWLEMSAPQAYNTIKAYPEMVNAPDCAKITIYPKSADHAGPPPDGPLEADLVQWLSMEALENGLACPTAAPPGEPGPLEQCNTALAEYQDCMSYAYWQVTDMDIVPNQNSSQGPCTSCHETGAGGALLSADPLKTFNAHADDEFYLVKMVRCVISDGEFLGLQASNRFLNKGTEGCTAINGNCHPDYTMNQVRQAALEMFVNNTVDAAKNGTCLELDEQAQIQLEQENQ